MFDEWIQNFIHSECHYLVRTTNSAQNFMFCIPMHCTYRSKCMKSNQIGNCMYEWFLIDSNYAPLLQYQFENVLNAHRSAYSYKSTLTFSYVRRTMNGWVFFFLLYSVSFSSVHTHVSICFDVEDVTESYPKNCIAKLYRIYFAHYLWITIMAVHWIKY